MRKLFLFFVLDHYITRIKAKHKAAYDKLSHDVKQKEADDDRDNR